MRPETPWASSSNPRPGNSREPHPKRLIDPTASLRTNTRFCPSTFLCRVKTQTSRELSVFLLIISITLPSWELRNRHRELPRLFSLPTDHNDQLLKCLLARSTHPFGRGATGKLHRCRLSDSPSLPLQLLYAGPSATHLGGGYQLHHDIQPFFSIHLDCRVHPSHGDVGHSKSP